MGLASRPATRHSWPCTQILVSSTGKKYYLLILQRFDLAPDSRSGASFFGLTRSPAGSYRAPSARSRYRGDGKSGMASSNLSKTGPFLIRAAIQPQGRVSIRSVFDTLT